MRALEALRPRYVALRIDAGRIRIRWWIPLAALEDTVVVLARFAPLVAHLRAAARREPEPRGLATGFATGLARALRDLASSDPRGTLDLPSGEPYARIETNDLTIEIAPL